MMTMREILFRGKRSDNGEWVYGAYGNHTSLDAMIIDRPYLTSSSDLSAFNFWMVDPATVGQYTGLYDATKWEALSESEQEEWLETHTADEWKGRKIFEGDIVTYDKEYGGETREKGVVYWCDGAFWVENVQDEEGYGLLGVLVKYHLEVIGNIHDNPELLEESNG